VVAVGAPHHVTQRGNNRQRVFFSDSDRQVYTAFLAERCRKFALTVLGYCLMPNHIHLVAVPERADSLARALGRAHYDYATYFNLRKRHSGHVWQNRFYSTPPGRDPLGIAHFNEDVAIRGSERGARRACGTRWRLPLVERAGACRGPRPERRAGHGNLEADLSLRGLGASVGREQRRRTTGRAAAASHADRPRPYGPQSFVTALEQTLQRPLHRRKPGPAKRSAAGAGG
jgi:putative transposase